MSDRESVPDPTPPRRSSAAGDTLSRGKQGRRKEKKPRTGGPKARPPPWRGLIEACLGNDNCAWKRLVEHCRPVCLRQGRHVLGKRLASYVDDAAQEALLEVVLSLHTWKGQSRPSFLAWVRTIATRAALHFRQRIDGGSVVELTAAGQMAASLRIHAHQKANRRLDDLLEALGVRLSQRQQRVLKGRLTGISQLQLAEQLGVTDRTIRNDIRAIGRQVKEFLEISERQHEFLSGKVLREPT